MVNTQSKEFKFRLIAFSLFVVSWLILLGIKLGSPDTSLKIPFIFSIVLTVIFIISLFARKIYELTQKLKSNEDNPKPLTEEEIEEIEKKEIKKMWNYIEKGHVTKRTSQNINNSEIYEHHIKLYRDVNLGKEKIDKIIILINATFPDLKPTILPSDCGEAEIREQKNMMSKNPFNPDIEETELSTDPFGKPIQKTKRLSYAKPEKKEEEVI